MQGALLRAVAVAEGVGEMAFREIVDIRALRVREAAEYARMAEVPREQLVLPVAAVLQHHAVAARPLARLHDVPAVVERVCGRNLHQHVLPRVHRVKRDARMKIGRHGHIDHVHARIVARPLPALARPGIEPLRHLAGTVLLQPLLVLFHRLLAQIAEHLDLASGYPADAPHGGAASVADADESDPYPLHRRRGKPRHCGLTL